MSVKGIVIARWKHWLLFAADYDGWGNWAAWVDRDSCIPLPDDEHTSDEPQK